jgi:hypothetical protein
MSTRVVPARPAFLTPEDEAIADRLPASRRWVWHSMTTEERNKEGKFSGLRLARKFATDEVIE